MVSLFQNMISLVSCQHIYVPNHVWVQLSVGVMNGWMGYIYTHTVIPNTINSWSYMSLVWLNNIKGSALRDLALLVSQSSYLRFYERARITWSIKFTDNTRNVTENEFLYSFQYISQYLPHDWQSRSHVSSTIQFLFYYVQIHIYTISILRTKVRAYHLKLYVTTCFQILILDYNLRVFCYLIGLYFVSSHMWQFSTYSKDKNILECRA